MQESVPSAVRAHMKAGSTSLRFEKLVLEGKTVYLHHYVHSEVSDAALDKLAGRKPLTRPITREDLAPGNLPRTFLFYVDIFIEEGNAWRLLHSLRYTDEGDISQILVKYLQPRAKRGPIILLNRGYTHWRRWILLVFPEGIDGPKSLVQDFLYGSEGAVYTMQTFAKMDSRGYLLVDEETRDEENGRPHKVTYRWDGERFTDPEARWFIIAATSKRREEMQSFMVRKQLIHTAELTRSERFPKLVPGLWMVIIERCRTQKAAKETASLRRKAGLDCYAKQAF